MKLNRLSLTWLAGTLLCAPVLAQNPTEQAAPKWTGQVNLGWSSSSGNSQSDNLSAGASAERRSEQDRISAAADYARSSQTNTTTGQKTTTDDWYRVLGQYDYFFTHKFFGFVNGRYEVDKIALLDYRLLMGAGVGYQLVENDRTKVGLQAGLAWKQEDYQNATSKASDTTAQLGYKVSHQILETLNFVHDLTYYPVLDDFEDSYLTTTAELRANFTANMFTNFKVIYTRDSTPAAGQRNSDIKYILGVGYNF